MDIAAIDFRAAALDVMDYMVPAAECWLPGGYQAHPFFN
jgi:hypothetical protein